MLTPWLWFVDKVLPGLFLAVSVAVGGASLSVLNSVSKLSNQINIHEARLNALEAKIERSVSDDRLLEILKRVEQQLEIVMLKNGLSNAKIKLTE